MGPYGRYECCPKISPDSFTDTQVMPCPECQWILPPSGIVQVNSGHTDLGGRPLPPAQGPLKCLLLNARSLIKHSVECALFIVEHNVKIAITESWSDEASGPDLVKATPPDFICYTLDRPVKRGGGLAIIYHNSLKPSFAKASNQSCEALSIKIHISGHESFNSMLLYRPPGPRGLFLDSIGTLLEEGFCDKSFTVLGDFNFYLEDLSDADNLRLQQIFNGVDMKQLVMDPTHSAGHTLDGIFSNNPNLTYTKTLALTWTDHSAILFDFKLDMRSQLKFHAKSVTNTRAWKGMDTLALDNLLQTSLPAPSFNVEEATAAYTEWLDSACRQLVPTKRCILKRAMPSAPWYTENLKLHKLECKKFERTWRKGYSNSDRETYKASLSSYKKAVAESKRNYFGELIRKAGPSSKTLFKTISNLTSHPCAKVGGNSVIM